MRARRGGFRSGGLRPFGGGFMNTDAAFALPDPPTAGTPPTRVQPPPRGGPRSIPVPVLPPAPTIAGGPGVSPVLPPGGVVVKR